MGLVHRVAPVADFDAAFAAYCANIAENAPLAMRASKAIVNQVAGGLADADLARCQELSDACKASEDHVEGRRAFMEKRRPQFRGR
jgi:1,4-dihydroxy-2-naphthoyl-CoA synthase